MIRALLIPIVLIAVVLFLFWTGQRKMIYYPFGEVPSPAQVRVRSQSRSQRSRT